MKRKKKKNCFTIDKVGFMEFKAFLASFLPKGRSILFNHFIDMRTTVSLSISCRKNTFFLHEMDKLTIVLMSIK